MQKNENIIFALIFGSFNSASFSKVSDIDVGFLSKKEFDLIELGIIIADLEKITRKKIDFIELNDLYKKNHCCLTK